MRHLVLAALVLTTAACRPSYVSTGELHRLETVLSLSPTQRPAWDAFRREAEAASGPRAGWRIQLEEAMAGERFDATRAHAAADSARDDAGRLIEAWRRLDENLTPAQRDALRSR